MLKRRMLAVVTSTHRTLPPTYMHALPIGMGANHPITITMYGKKGRVACQ